MAAITPSEPVSTSTQEIHTKKMWKTLVGHVPISSPFYQFHPVTRLYLFVFLGVVPLFIFVPEINFLLVLVSMALMLWGRADLRGLRIYAPMVVTVAIFMFTVVILAPGKDPTYTPLHMSLITIYYQPVFFTFAAYWRLMAMLSGTILYFSTNRERDMLVALRAVRLPFVASYVIGLSIRAAGMFMEDFRTIREAEQARGLDTKAMRISDQVKLYVMYLVPLFSIALRRAEEISNALFARGYTVTGRVKGGGQRRDYIRSLYAIRTRDVIAIVILISLFVGAGISNLFFNVFVITDSPLNIYLRGVLNIP